MNQSLLDELSGTIRLGLEERNVPITRAGWVLEWREDTGWQLATRLQPGIPLLAAWNQLVVFREEEEIRPVLEFLPAPPFSRKAFMAAARAEPKSREERQRLAAGAERAPLRTGFLEQANPRAILEQLIIDVDAVFLEIAEGSGSRTAVQFEPDIKASLSRLRDFIPVR